MTLRKSASKTVILIFALVTLGRLTGVASDLPLTQRIYSTIHYEIIDFEYSKGGKIITNVPITGTCWVVSLGGESAIITAAHNLGLSKPLSVGPYDFDKSLAHYSVLLSLTSRPVIGILAYDIKELGFVGHELDCVLIRPIQEDALKRSRMIRVAPTAPRTGDKVKVYGFPGTAVEKPKEVLVAGVALNNQFITLNDDLKGGYSGGLVLNADNEAVALVVTSTEQQSSALILSEKLLRNAKWKSFGDLKRQEF